MIFDLKFIFMRKLLKKDHPNKIVIKSITDEFFQKFQLKPKIVNFCNFSAQFDQQFPFAQKRHCGGKTKI